MSSNSFQGEAQDGGADERTEAAVTAPESGATTPPEDASTGASGDEDQEDPQPKTFTQEDVDKIAQKEREQGYRKAKRELEQQAQQQQIQDAANAPEPKPEEYNSPVEYAEALADHKLAKKLAEQQAQQQQVQVVNTYAQREEVARDKYPDFEAVAYNDNLPLTRAMSEVILASEVGPDLAYHLGKNPGEAERISRLTPLQQAVELGKIEVTLTPAASTPTPAKKVPSAPEPIAPVGSRTSNPTYDPTDPRSVKMPVKDWMKARNEQVAKRHH